MFSQHPLKVIAIVALIMSCLTVNTNASEANKTTAQDKLQQNKQLVLDFYQQVLLEGELDRVNQFITDAYIQHNPGVKDGKAGLIEFLSPMAKPAEGKPRGKIVRAMAEGDLVMVHVHWYGWPTERGTATIDIFRIEKGLIAEHWDVVQAVPETAKNTNTMF